MFDVHQSQKDAAQQQHVYYLTADSEYNAIEVLVNGESIPFERREEVSILKLKIKKTLLWQVKSSVFTIYRFGNQALVF